MENIDNFQYIPQPNGLDFYIPGGSIIIYMGDDYFV